MAPLAVTLAVICSLLVLSHARTPFNLPANDVQLTEPLTRSWESNVATATEEPEQLVRLPSEQTNSVTVTTADLPLSDNVNEIEAIGITRPLTLSYDARLRPINRHFHHMPVQRPLRVGFPSRCRHHVSGREISYGNDMVVDRVGQIPVRSQGFSSEKRRRFPVRWFDVKTVVGERKEREEGGFLKRYREFLNRF